MKAVIPVPVVFFTVCGVHTFVYLMLLSKLEPKMVEKVFALISLRCDIFEIGITIFITQNVQHGILSNYFPCSE